MFIFEVFDHQKIKVVGIYTNMSAARAKVMEITGESYSSRYKLWPRQVSNVIYETELDCIYPEYREQDQDDHFLSDANAVPF